jgi:CubicO group peptidase (beta-lactamase class C family)
MGSQSPTSRCANRALVGIHLCPFFYLLVFSLITPTSGWAQTQSTDAKQLEAIFESYAQSKDFTGAVLVTAADNTLFERNYGCANLDWQIPVNPDTKFRIGSLTKQFTAALILLLQQDGRVHLADSITNYLPSAPSSWKQITITNLLSQTSGIPEFMASPEASAWSMSVRNHAEIISFIERNPTEFKPGARYAYSNSNYEVLGAIIEKVTGRQYAEELSERILKPLALAATGVDTDELILPKRADGYRRLSSGLIRARPGSMSVAWAAGGMYSTTHDLAKWERALYQGKLLSNESKQLMTTPGLGSYGLGIEVSQVDGTIVYRHGGSIDGFNSFLSFIPSKEMSVVVLANLEGTAAAGMGAQLDDAVLGKPVVLLNEHKAVPISTKELTKFEGVFQFSPTFSLKFSISGDRLIAASPGDPNPPLPLVYEGVRNGHAFFFVKEVMAELEFVPAGAANLNTVILHQAGHDETGRRK